MTLRVAVIVPWRFKGDVNRHANLVAVLHHLSQVAPEWDVIISSDGREGAAPFNRSAAYNRGIAEAGLADAYVFHEADMLIPKAQLTAAVILALGAPGMVVPFDTYRYLSSEDTSKVRAGLRPEAFTPQSVMVDGRSNGACNVVSATAMRAVGHWDEAFEGWGYDDRAMATAFHVATGTPTRYVAGPGHHLWHTPGWSLESRFRGGANIPPHEHAATVANEARYRLYRKARTAERIRELTHCTGNV